MTDFIQTFQERKIELLSALSEHLQISLISLFFAVIIAVPLGIILTRKERMAEFIIGTSAVMQTVPSLATWTINSVSRNWKTASYNRISCVCTITYFTKYIYRNTGIR